MSTPAAIAAQTVICANDSNEDHRDFSMGGIADLSKSEISNITSGYYGATLGRSDFVTSHFLDNALNLP